MLNALDIDPKNLEFDFGRDWLNFQNGKIHTFFILWSRLQIEKGHLAMEQAKTIEEVRDLQGQIRICRGLVTMLLQSSVNDNVVQVCEFLKTNYGR